MIAKKRIFKALEHEEPDKIPIFEASIDNLEICNYFGTKYQFKGAKSRIKRGYYYCFGSDKYFNWWVKRLAKKKFVIKLILNRIFKLYTQIGIDLFCAPLGLIPLIWKKNGFIDEFGREFKIIKDPKTNIDIIYYTNGIFETIEDYYNFPKPNPDNLIKKNIFRISKELEKKYKGKIFIGFLILGIFESVWQAFGLNIFSKLIRNGDAFKIISERAYYLFEIIKKIGEWGDYEEGIIFLSDDYGYKNGLFMNPKLYRRYIVPHIDYACRLAHKNNLKVIMHSCGDIYDIFSDLVNSNIDAIHPIEPTTSNPKYNIFNLYREYGDKICFIGNVSPQDLAEKDENYIYEYTTKLLTKLAPNGGFILSSGHSINPAVKLDNFLAMKKALEDYQKIKVIKESIESYEKMSEKERLYKYMNRHCIK